MEDEARRNELEEEYILRTYLYMDADTISKLSDKVKSDHAQLIKDKLSDEKKRLLTTLKVPYEPKRNNRWLARFPEKIGIQEWWESETSRPSCTFAEDGVVKYNPITFKLRDAIGPSSSQCINRLMIGMTSHLSDFEASKRIREEFKEERENGFDYKLELLDPTGCVIEEWDIMGCKLLSIDYGKLDMSDDGICEITVILQPDKFVQLY
tara:strand:+ start:1132 stop:1758 length:627 start_codon:yes stop_codon:yes gene_type:complete